MDVIFLDIQLSDGESFEIINRTDVTTPVIFTTAYDEYATKAFKVNSVDYLLKPLDKGELEIAINKFESGIQEDVQPQQSYDPLLMQNLLNQNPTNKKDRYVIKIEENIKNVHFDTILN